LKIRWASALVGSSPTLGIYFEEFCYFMIAKIVLEIILALVTLSIGSLFWNCVKSPIILGRLFTDYTEIKKLSQYLGKEKIINNPNLLNKGIVFGNDSLWFQTSIASWIKASVSTLDKIRNVLFLLAALVLILSFFLNHTFLIINLILFLVTLLPANKIHKSALANLFQDIHVLMTHVYRWNIIDQSSCKSFCNIEQPRFLKNIYRVVVEEPLV
ncbi:MAG: hypothetical protein ACREBJ_11125, partial [Nitrosotalea sp.]